MKLRLQSSQKKVLADYFNNISAGWFITGVVAPLLLINEMSWAIIIKVILSFIFSIIVISLSLYITKQTR